MRINKKISVIHGSLTVEAALVLPVFIYIIIAFIYFLQIIRLQESLQNAITETGLFSAKYAYVYDYVTEYGKEDTNHPADTKEMTETNGIGETPAENTQNNLSSSVEEVIAKTIDSAYYKVKMQDYLDISTINRFCIKNGFDGIHTYLSGFLKEDNAIDIIVSYDIRLPLMFLNIQDIPVMQRVRLRGWNGHRVALKNESSDSPSPSEDNEKMVYITETGTVYHLYRDCTYLRLSIREVNIGQVGNLRNEAGGKYTECNLCKDSAADGIQTVYITDSGDRYHWNLACSGLKRTVITIPISQVGDRNLCSRCRVRSE